MTDQCSMAVTMILGDGGIKAGFIAGAADEVLRNCPDVADRLHQMVGASASAGNIIYYLALGENHPGKEMWTSLLTDQRFMHFDGVRDLYSETPLYDIDYMVEKIFREGNPIAQHTVKSHKVKFYIPTQRYHDSKLIYFTNDPTAISGEFDTKQREFRDADSVDLYELMKAASAAPLISDDVFDIGGEKFMDAAAIEPLPIDLAPTANSFKIVILTKGKAGFFKKLRYLSVAIGFVLLVRPFKRRRLSIGKYLQYGTKPFRLNREIDLALAEERAGRAVVIVPKRKIGGLLDNSPATLRQTYDHGAECAREKFSYIVRALSAS